MLIFGIHGFRALHDKLDTIRVCPVKAVRQREDDLKMSRRVQHLHLFIDGFLCIYHAHRLRRSMGQDLERALKTQGRLVEKKKLWIVQDTIAIGGVLDVGIKSYYFLDIM